MDEILDESIFEEKTQALLPRDLAKNAYLQQGRGRSLMAVSNVTGIPFSNVLLWSKSDNWDILAVEFDSEQDRKNLEEGEKIFAAGKRDPKHALIFSNMSDLVLLELKKLLVQSSSTDTPILSPSILLRMSREIFSSERTLHGQSVANLSVGWGDEDFEGMSQESLDEIEEMLLKKSMNS